MTPRGYLSQDAYDRRADRIGDLVETDDIALIPVDYLMRSPGAATSIMDAEEEASAE